MSDPIQAQRDAVDLIAAALRQPLDGGAALGAKNASISPYHANLVAVSAAAYAAHAIRSLAAASGRSPEELVELLRVPFDGRPGLVVADG